ncbi:MAG: YggS family pyridoxal phosphate-dependent enzyme [Bdellovibrionaceae bacterium]|nr:YggS family pyridoxal phosphate-dependent enzyme [Pseudobdellovibrionaceae bacterium]MDW8191269.1 YggS family pyridoxal phosphate-dependent enzyme [Pseudobdellovibrionaceae bacterium]
MTLHQIKAKIPSHCRLIAVSKKQPISAILELYHAGCRDFGENYSQELIEKQFELKEINDIRWHFIGNIQKNKLKHLVGIVEYIHSVGSIDIARIISEIAEKKGLTQKILLQLNLAHESTKNGFTEDELLRFLPDIIALPNVEVVGLMTLPPLYNNHENVRPFFRQLRTLRDQLQNEYPSIKELSMGTSQDYLIAIEEGATMIRLGTLLFGPRPSST